MRNLASIKRINEIHPIKDRDRIVLAIIDGWSVIVKKDEFKVGDLCVYVEIDSVLPEREEFEFLRDKNFRIKTMKMAGVISQGICFPLDILPDDLCIVEGADVTDIIGVKKWERQDASDVQDKPIAVQKRKYPKWLMRIPLFRKLLWKKNGKEARDFPSFISKTDETRIQNAPFFLAPDEPWVVTEKVDGQSGTFALVRHKSKLPWKEDAFEYIVCSRNVRLYHKDSSSYWKVSDKYNIENCLRELIGDDEWVAIQGECIAPNVQGNKYKVTEPDLFVFNLLRPYGRMGSLTAKEICENIGLKFVPIIDERKYLPKSVDNMLKYAHGKSALGDTLREGVVCRSADGRKSFKAVDPLFLIKYNE